MIVTVDKVRNSDGEIIADTTAKAWRNIQAQETETTMTIEILVD
jgi:hypothetical protein